MPVEKITPEFCEDKTLLFYPKSNEDAKFIMHTLYALGFAKGVPPSAEQEAEEDLTYTIEKGIVLKSDGYVYVNPMPATIAEATLCTSAQFGIPTGKDTLPECNDSIIQQFNQNAERMERLTAAVQRLELQIEKFNKKVAPDPWRKVL
jgi:hypothetical protein